MSTSKDRTSIVVVGAGYAGLLAANRASAHGHQVTLINERPTFIDRIRLHEFIAGTRADTATARPLNQLTRKIVHLVVGRATGYATGTVTLDDGRTVAGDHVLITTGSSAGSGSWEWAVQARNALADLADGATVAVVGAGLTGVEVATEIAASRRHVRVTLVDPVEPGAGLSPNARTYLDETLQRLHVTVVSEAPVAADLTIDCTGFSHDRLTDARPLLVDEFLRVPGLERVWAAGDVVRVEGQPHLRMACASAEPMAAHSVDQISRMAKGQPLQPVSIGFAGQCLSLGRRDAMVQFVNRDDTPTDRVWRGRVAASAKELLCRFALATPARWARFYRELNGPTYARAV